MEMHNTYAQITANLSNLNYEQKLEFCIRKISAIETVSAELQSKTAELSDAYNAIDQMGIQIALLQERATKAELRVIDLEARSRRCNLVFHNIPEQFRESDDQCKETLFHFLGGQLGLSDQQIYDVYLQRVHRLGQKRGRKPRPIIAGFRDFPCRQFILDNAYKLRGTRYAIQEDFPAEIRSARGQLWPEYCRAKDQGRDAKLIYPAKLAVDNTIVEDKFPGWGKWNITKNNDDSQASTGNRSSRQQPPQPPRTQPAPLPRPQPRTGSSMHVPMADLVNAGQSIPQSQNSERNHGQHPQAQSTPVQHPQPDYTPVRQPQPDYTPVQQPQYTTPVQQPQVEHTAPVQQPQPVYTPTQPPQPEYTPVQQPQPDYTPVVQQPQQANDPFLQPMTPPRSFSQEINDAIISGIATTPPFTDSDLPPQYMALNHSLPNAISEALVNVYNGNEL